MPTTPAVTAAMKGNRKRDTRPEVAFRSALQARGLRFRKDHSIKPDEGGAIRADVVFTRARIAIFVDGCFWHRCPEHGNEPRANLRYWRPKLERNVERDLQTNARLEAAGWTVLRVWEHEDPASAADRIVDLMRAAPGRS
jgi:DNA mismatch endonuclease (patch repair protein)